MFDFKTRSGFLAGAAAFAAVFWIVGFFLYTLLTAWQRMGSQGEQSGQALDQRYAQQLSETERQIAVSKAQQDRMQAILARQEEQSRRFDAILATWEQQARRADRP